jgi:excisionase family DNA binding protein
MRIPQDPDEAELMSARDVESLLGIDKSTVYRMAYDGRLPAIKVGRQWRFLAEPIRGMLDAAGSDAERAVRDARPAPPTTISVGDASRVQPVIEVAADLLGVMMVVTDMDGNPASEIANPCPWFVERQQDPAILDACVKDWHAFADEREFAPAFRVGPHGFECARALLRDGNQLVGMVLAGGIAPGDAAPGVEPDASDGLYHKTAEERAKLLAALPRIAGSLSHVDS